jgi:FAD/FMN-containing dehydrogenase
MSNEALDCIIEYANKLPSPQCEIFIAVISGAANHVPSDAMAYGHRDANFVLNVHSRWDAPSDDDKCVVWAKDFFNASQPYASGGAYINFMTEDEIDRVAAAFGPNHARLVEIKKKYDPDNVFHLNQNITP